MQPAGIIPYVTEQLSLKQRAITGSHGARLTQKTASLFGNSKPSVLHDNITTTKEVKGDFWSSNFPHPPALQLFQQWITGVGHDLTATRLFYLGGHT
jgi:hypothetical protein